MVLEHSVQDHMVLDVSLNASGHAPGAMCFFKYGPGAYLTQNILHDYEWSERDHMVLEHNRTIRFWT